MNTKKSDKTDENISNLEKCYKNIIEDVGEDIKREGLLLTPRRAAKAIKFLTKGYTENLKKIINNAIFESESDEMIMVRNI